MYKDAQGDLSERSIEVRAVTGFADKKDPGLIHFEYMEGYCFTKRAKRNFRLDRIKRLTDSETGEVVEAKNSHSIRAWLCDLLISGEIA